ncbi:MAG TPA: hypothetical protein VM537_19260 [Anaerolineae bacterium]|nr:hypothetical protein [Anaerolineae bacterium]
MISKTIHPGTWFRDTPMARLLDVHSQGMERGQLLKIAASDFIMASDITPVKGHSFVHLISTGAGDWYGANNNADFFNEKEGSYSYPEPAEGVPATVMLDGGLCKYHHTFMKFGGVYEEHNNSKRGAEPKGSIALECVNPAMHRGELIIELDNDVWASDLHKLANNEPVFFSMGCGVPFDRCSICGNQAATRKSYCDHLRFNKLGLSKTGHQVFAINDKPHFHDISKVKTPADRIAFALRKVASEGTVLDIGEDGGLWVPVRLVEKIGNQTEVARASLLEKLSEMNKRIVVQGMSPEESDLSESFDSPEIDDETVKALQGFPLEDVLNALKSRDIMLPPKAMIRVAVKKPAEQIEGLDELPCACKDVFSQIKEGSAGDIIGDASYIPLFPKVWTRLEEIADKLAADFSLKDDAVQRRLMTSAIRGGRSLGKRAGLLVSTTPGAESRYLAREYANYQLSLLAGTSPAYAHRVVVHNQVTR